MKSSLFLITIFTALLYSCSTGTVKPSDDDDQQSTKPNILLIISDDMGLDATPNYSVGNIKPSMPNIENMMQTGIKFNNMWSYQVCTPTRASMLTGKYGFRTGVLKVGDDLPNTETSIHQYLKNESTGYHSAIVGKWHLGTDASNLSQFGIDYYAGLLSGGVPDYTNWTLNENGVNTNSTEYTTTKFTDLAIDWIKDQDRPWFLWLAYNAPHTPFHLPPSNLHSQGDLPADQASINNNPLPYYLAAIEAMDSEIGRLLNTMSEKERANTLIIFVGDNGSPRRVVQEYRRRRAKGSLYQGGVNVPMVVSGKNVTRFNQTESALFTVSDIFATVADLAGVNVQTIHDSHSFENFLTDASATPTRNYAYTELGNNTNTEDFAIRNTTHKYISFSDGTEALYNLQDDFLETRNLLNANQLPLSETDEAQLTSLQEAVINLKQ